MTETPISQDLFEQSWLTLREPADAAARSQVLAVRLADWVEARPPVRIVDLGAGTGSALRWLSPRLTHPQHWRLVDGDASLLNAAAQTRLPVQVEISTLLTDLAQADLTALLEGADILSASALLDLVSEAWIERLAAASRTAGCAAWLTLSVSGSHDWDPVAPQDREVAEAFARDQARDKGFGVSLGPDAVGRAEQIYRAAGFDTVLEPSDWRLGPPDRALLTAFVDGYAAAAAAARPELSSTVRSWRALRLAQIDADALRLRVGHQDLLALPR